MIVLIGDSFCADYDLKYWPGYHRRGQKYSEGGKRSWVTDIIEHYDQQVDVHGYGGCSWWYSWIKASSVYKDRWNEVSTVIFVHTNPSRINNSWNDELTNIPDTSIFASSATDVFFKHIIDQEFQEFAQEAYMYMIQRQFYNIRTIHFCSFGSDGSLGPNMALLPGMVYTTPLIHIAIGGITGTKKEIDRQFLDNGDRRLINHFTKHNNSAMARLVIDSIENYVPGHHIIDFNKYGFDMPNPNYANWPAGEYRTK